MVISVMVHPADIGLFQRKGKLARLPTLGEINDPFRRSSTRRKTLSKSLRTARYLTLTICPPETPSIHLDLAFAKRGPPSRASTRNTSLPLHMSLIDQPFPTED